MDISFLSRKNALLGLVAGVSLLSAFGTAAWCHKCEGNMVGDGHIIQMLDRIDEQQALGLALAQIRQGDLQGASDRLAARMGDNAVCIQQLVLAASEKYRPLAEALAQNQIVAAPAELPMHAQAESPPATD